MTFLQPRKQLGLVRKQNFSPSFDLPLTSSIIPTKGVSQGTFTRSTTGTVVDFEGVIHTAKINEARFEGARRVENLTDYSQDFTNAKWIKTDSTITANTITAPDGTLTASKYVETATTALHKMQRGNNNPIVEAGSQYIISIYVKAGERTDLTFRFAEVGFGNQGFNFDLATGLIGTEWESPDNTGVVDCGNGWYKIYVMATADTTGRGGPFITVNNGVSTSRDGKVYLGDGTSGIYVWGAQVERVTGTQTEASDYVSTNVLSAPYHGANVDGVRYFLTDREDP